MQNAMATYKTHPYYTHQPFLGEILKHTTGDVLECGCGDGSTVFMRSILASTTRRLVSLESNREWLAKYTHLADANHQLYHVDAGFDDTIETGSKWVDLLKTKNLNNGNDFEVVFLDSTPWMSRKCCFDYFLDKAKIIVVHDFDYFPINNIIGKVTKKEFDGRIEKIECDLSDVVKNFKLFYPPDEFFVQWTGPPTLVCSNLLSNEDFDALIKTVEQNVASYYM